MESSASPAAESKAMEVCLLIICFFMFARFNLGDKVPSFFRTVAVSECVFFFEIYTG